MYISSLIAIYELQKIGPFLDLYVFSYIRGCSLYDVTVKSMGYDEIRVRYRTQRRKLLRHIIEEELTGDSLKEYIFLESAKVVPYKDLEDFRGDVFEDLKEMDSSRIIGLGITLKQLNHWLDLQKH